MFQWTAVFLLLPLRYFFCMQAGLVKKGSDISFSYGQSLVREKYEDLSLFKLQTNCSAANYSVYRRNVTFKQRRSSNFLRETSSPFAKLRVIRYYVKEDLTL